MNQFIIMKEYRYVTILGYKTLHKIKFPEQNKTRCGKTLESYDSRYRSKLSNKRLCINCFKHKENK